MQYIRDSGKEIFAYANIYHVGNLISYLEQVDL
jgi:hypothetical protein